MCNVYCVCICVYIYTCVCVCVCVVCCVCVLPLLPRLAPVCAQQDPKASRPSRGGLLRCEKLGVWMVLKSCWSRLVNVFTWSGALDIFRPTYKLLECDIIRSSRTAGRAWGTSHGVMTGGLHSGSFEANVLHAASI